LQSYFYNKSAMDTVIQSATSVGYFPPFLCAAFTNRVFSSNPIATPNVPIPTANQADMGLSPGNKTNEPTTVKPFLAVATVVAGVAPECLTR
jgi:hypothetical protein